MFKVRALAVRKGFLCQIFIFLFLCLTIIIAYKTDAHATTASITVNGNININHQWGTEGVNFKDYYEHLDVAAKTDSPTGYQLYFSSASEENALIGTNTRNLQKIKSVTGSYNNLSQYPNNSLYGYNLEATDNNIYREIPKLGHPNKIKVRESSGEDHINFNLGIQISKDVLSDNYRGSLTFSMIAEDDGGIANLVSGQKINQAIRKVLNIQDESYFTDPTKQIPEDYNYVPSLEIAIARQKCSPLITPELTQVISTPDSEATVYLSIYPGSYEDWKPTCIWTSATEIVFPEDLSYLFAGINGTTYEPKFTFKDNKTLNMLDFSQVKNISHLFHNTRPWMGHSRSFNVSTFISYLKDSPIENMESAFESEFITKIENPLFVKNVTNLKRAFKDVNADHGIDLSTLNGDVVTNAESAFENSKFSTINLSTASFKNIPSAKNMFKDTSASKISLDNATFNSVIDASSMFKNSSASKISLDQATFSNTVDASSMFEGSKIYQLSLPSATFNKTENFSKMFMDTKNYSNSSTLDLSKIDLKQAKDTSFMFKNLKAKNLTLNHSEPMGENITNAESMFEFCDYLVSLDLTNLSFAKNTSFKNFLKNDESLESLTLPNNLNSTTTTDFSSMFENCTSLTTINHIDKLRLDNAINLSRMYFNVRNIYMDDIISKLIANKATDISYMFASTYTKNPVVFPATFNTSMAQNMKGMFESHRGPLIDLSNFRFDNVEDMSDIFAKPGVSDIKWPSHQNAPKLITLSGAFRGNTNFQKVKAPKITAPLLKDTSYMFSSMNRVTEFDIDDFDTSNVENMQHMFSNNREYFMPREAIVNFNLNTSHVKDLSYFLYHARTWHPVVNTFDTRNVTNMASTFEEVWAKPELDLTGWDTSKVTNMTRMFYDSSYIERIYVSDTFVTTNVIASSGIFGGSFTNLRGQQGTSVPGHDISYARIDGGPSNPGAFWRKP